MRLRWRFFGALATQEHEAEHKEGQSDAQKGRPDRQAERDGQTYAHRDECNAERTVIGWLILHRPPSSSFSASPALLFEIAKNAAPRAMKVAPSAVLPLRKNAREVKKNAADANR